MTEWQPIETAPKDKTPVDLWWRYSDGSGKRIANCYWQEVYSAHGHCESPQMAGVYPDGWQAGRDGAPSHWMPLPEPPAEPPQ